MDKGKSVISNMDKGKSVIEELAPPLPSDGLDAHVPVPPLPSDGLHAHVPVRHVLLYLVGLESSTMVFGYHLPPFTNTIRTMALLFVHRD